MNKSQPYKTKSGPNRPPGHEVKDANVKIIIILTLFFLLSSVVMHGLLWGVLKQMSHNISRLDDWATSQPKFQGTSLTAPPTNFPKLQMSPQADFSQFRRREEALLNSYGWVDRDRGIARIPINAAMDLVLKKGLPTRKDDKQPSTNSSPLQLQQERARSQETPK
ncbi:MAG: hypothetical protein ACTHMT_02245 [Verrucomicrobiota bacterium]